MELAVVVTWPAADYIAAGRPGADTVCSRLEDAAMFLAYSPTVTARCESFDIERRFLTRPGGSGWEVDDELTGGTVASFTNEALAARFADHIEKNPGIVDG